ncbi:MAG TPA: carboxypeptidase-like regulatory domain-containing protein, partial [Verrucomicrobiae bacterium]|nr:carboxypeptidase-like regulatory domain-containing protein [Verrucomicrobiae bacterium]
DGSVSLNPATTNIAGRVINAANSNGLAGLSGMAVSTNNLLSFYFTDTNGGFDVPVVSSLWEAPVDPFAAAFQGCLTWSTNQLLNVSNKVVSLTNALPQATAIFYGTVSNSSAVPMPGVYLYANDNQGHQSVGITDSRGRYVVGILAGTNLWQFSIQATNNPGLTNPYVFSPGYIQTTQVDPGQAILQNFSLVYAPYTISGTVADLDGHFIGGVEVFATNADDQAFSVWTGSAGSYSLDVSPGTWTVGIDPASLENLGYTNLPPNQTVTVTESGSGVSGVNFSIEVCGEIEILTTNLANAIVGQPYDAELQAISCQNIGTWSTAFGVTLTSLFDTTNILYTNGTAIYSDSQLVGYLQTEFGVTNAYDPTNKLDQPFFINCSGTARQVGSGWQFDSVSAPVNVTGPITNTTTVNINGITWTASATTPSGSSYSTTLTCSALPSASGDYYVGNGWFAGVGALITAGGAGSNRVASIVGAFHAITNAGTSAIAASSVPYTNVENLVVYIHQGNHIGQYLISAYGPQSTNMDGLGLYPDGSSAATISGTPLSTGTNGGAFNFSVMAEDTYSNVTVQPLSIFVFPATAITAPSSAQAGMVQSSNTFQMQLSGLTNSFNYTVLMSTNLPSTNWVPIFTANNPATNSLVVPDTAATNGSRFYRVQISQ